MASPAKYSVPLITLALLVCCGNAQLRPDFYAGRCRGNLQLIVRSEMDAAIRREVRLAASILRLFFHDCFVNGCDGSVLLDDTSTFTGEKNAAPNQNSIRGFEVIDAIKTRVDAACNSSVSCADVLALAAREAVSLRGGPTWTLPLGRLDARTASQAAANTNLPAPFASLTALITSFRAQNLSPQDMVALSGGHTIGSAQCSSFRTHIYNETNINPVFAAIRRRTCLLSSGSNTNLAPLDVLTQDGFDNSYYINLLVGSGLLHSDQELFSRGRGSDTDRLVQLYATNAFAFRRDFATAMVNMGNISPRAGTNLEVRRNCRVVNPN